MSFLTRWFGKAKPKPVEPMPYEAQVSCPPVNSDPFEIDPAFSEPDVQSQPSPERALIHEGNDLFESLGTPDSEPQRITLLEAPLLSAKESSIEADSGSHGLFDEEPLGCSSTPLLSVVNHMDINPASGLPMMDGIGGLDVGGNAYGFSDSGLSSGIGFDSDISSGFGDSFSGSSSFDNDW